MRRPRTNAFTLIELLVVVAIIALLISILLPSLQGAREQARAVVCGQKLKDIGNGMYTYFSEQDEWIPGVNTSGVALRAVQGMVGRYNEPEMPVQSYDWMTPILSQNIELKAAWEERWADIIENFNCPSQRAKAIIYSATGLTAQQRDFFNSRDWTGISYMMPAAFQWWGTRYDPQAAGGRAYKLADHQRNPLLPINAIPMPVQITAKHQTYRSRLSEVGNAAQKILVADGTRYLDQNEVLDFDVNPFPGIYGSFSSAGAFWSGSTAYGVGPNTSNWNGRTISYSSPGRGGNVPLSYRHGSQANTRSAQDNRGKINALFFDGSVRRLSDRESRSPVLWYPRGSVIESDRSPSEFMIEDLNPGDMIP